MRKILSIVGIALLGAVGCKHVGGKCDCGPQPGEAALYAPMHGYPTTSTAGSTGPVVREVINAPKELPKK